VYCVAALIRLKHTIKIKYKKPFFIMLSAGMILYAIAETIRNLLEFGLGMAEFPSIAEVFHICGAVAFIIGFLYFWIVTKAWSKFTLRDWGLLLLGIALSAGYMAYLFFGIIIPEGMHHNLLVNILNLFYPVAATAAFILSYVLHTHYREGLVRRAYLYLADGIFFIFLGDMFFAYVSWMGTYGVPGIMSDTFYMLGYITLAISFYIFYGKSKQ
jgi:hypothetical protein